MRTFLEPIDYVMMHMGKLKIILQRQNDNE